MDNNQNNQNQQYTPPQAAPQPRQIQPGVSKSELFVGMNILSKIGVIFIIIGVIALAVVTEEVLPDWARMGMVLLLGVIMFVGGEIFHKKGSVVFANALLYGAVLELAICPLIGHFGLDAWSGTTSQIIGLVASGLGVFLSVRHKSQPMLIVTLICSSLPIFAAEDSHIAVILGAGCLVAVHAANAIISRKNDYVGTFVTGISLTFLHTLFVIAQFDNVSYEKLVDDWGGRFAIFGVIFAICACFNYISGILLNAKESEGKLLSWENAGLWISFLSGAFSTHILLALEFENSVTGIGDIVFAIVAGVIAISYGLSYGSRCAVTTAMTNLSFICVCTAIMMLFEGLTIYIVLHLFAAAVLILGLYIKRNLFLAWGLTLLGFSEFIFLVLLISDPDESRIPAIIVNVVLWFVILAMYIIRKKHETMGFRVYTCLAMANAGFLISNVIMVEVKDALENAMFRGAECNMLCVLMCACVWMILGFAVGKPKYLEGCGLGFSVTFNAIGWVFLFISNLFSLFANMRDVRFEVLLVVVVIVVNVVSVLTVLDLTLQISKKSPKFTRAVGLIVSGYAMLSLTSVLNVNELVAFTSWIISIIYILFATAWIVIGFMKRNPILRRFGLALMLFSAAKLFLFDFSDIDSVGKTLLFIGFGITMLAVSFGYGIAEKKLKEKNTQ